VGEIEGLAETTGRRDGFERDCNGVKSFASETPQHVRAHLWHLPLDVETRSVSRSESIRCRNGFNDVDFS
jgi:hypothetical protein